MTPRNSDRTPSVAAVARSAAAADGQAHPGCCMRIRTVSSGCPASTPLPPAAPPARARCDKSQVSRPYNICTGNDLMHCGRRTRASRLRQSRRWRGAGPALSAAAPARPSCRRTTGACGYMESISAAAAPDAPCVPGAAAVFPPRWIKASRADTESENRVACNNQCPQMTSAKISW